MKRAGILTDQICLLTKVSTKSDFGSVSDSFVETKIVRASISQWKGGRQSIPFQEANLYDAKVVTRYGHGITESMRVKYDDVIYQIDSVINDKKDRSTTLLISKIKE